MRKHLFSMLVLVWLLACASQATRLTTIAATSPSREVSSATVTTPSAASVPATSAAPLASKSTEARKLKACAVPGGSGECGGISLDEEFGFRADEDRLDLSDLLLERKIPESPLSQDLTVCVRRRLGSKEGFLCKVYLPEVERTGHSVVFGRFVVLEGKTLREVLYFPHHARALDFPGSVYVTLRVDFDEARGTLRLADGVSPCNEAVRSVDQCEEYRTVVERVCNARGVYVWRNGGFQRQSSAAPLVWPGGAR